MSASEHSSQIGQQNQQGPIQEEPAQQGVFEQGQAAGQGRAWGEQYGLGVASMVCGIVAVPGAVLFAFLGIGLAVIAVVLAVVVRRSPQPTPRTATAGLILGITGLVLGVVNSIFGALLFSGRL